MYILYMHMPAKAVLRICRILTRIHNYMGDKKFIRAVFPAVDISRLQTSAVQTSPSLMVNLVITTVIETLRYEISTFLIRKRNFQLGPEVVFVKTEKYTETGSVFSSHI